jgi:hypothetical protein
MIFSGQGSARLITVSTIMASNIMMPVVLYGRIRSNTHRVSRRKLISASFSLNLIVFEFIIPLSTRYKVVKKFILPYGQNTT